MTAAKVWLTLRSGRRRRACRGIAALEFALVAPVLLTMVGGVAQLGIEVWARSVLANAVAQGGYYASSNGPTVTPSSIETLVEKTSSLSGVTATATTPATYCASGNPATLTASSNSTCADGTTPGTYTTISASYSMISILPAFTGLGDAKLVESATVRLQ